MKALFDEEAETGLAKRQTTFLKREFSTIDGDASLRIVKLAIELASSSMTRKT